jgi:hypothetical protein
VPGDEKRGDIGQMADWRIQAMGEGGVVQAKGYREENYIRDGKNRSIGQQEDKGEKLIVPKP